jgi:spermidine synthase
MINTIASAMLLTCCLAAAPPTVFLQDYYFLQFQTQKMDPAETVRCEMIAHVPLLAHENPKSILIIGDQDGGIAREVQKHPNIERIFVVNTSSQKTEVDDARVTKLEQDPTRFVKKSNETFDVILCDLVDIPASAEFYADCKDLLNKRGIFVNNSGTPLIQQDSLGPDTANRSPHFKHTTYYLASTPQGQVAYGWASDKKYRVSESVLEMRLTKIKEPMLYYTPEAHKAAFALPNFIISCSRN